MHLPLLETIPFDVETELYSSPKNKEGCPFKKLHFFRYIGTLHQLRVV